MNVQSAETIGGMTTMAIAKSDILRMIVRINDRDDP